MGEASRFILTARVDDVQGSTAEAALANFGGQTVDSVSGSAPASSDI
jgi:phosphoribosylformylglycinamidine (FGAM) synthase PurS component